MSRPKRQYWYKKLGPAKWGVFAAHTPGRALIFKRTRAEAGDLVKVLLANRNNDNLN